MIVLIFIYQRVILKAVTECRIFFSVLHCLEGSSCLWPLTCSSFIGIVCGGFSSSGDIRGHKKCFGLDSLTFLMQVLVLLFTAFLEDCFRTFLSQGCLVKKKIHSLLYDLIHLKLVCQIRLDITSTFQSAVNVIWEYGHNKTRKWTLNGRRYCFV